MKFKVNQRVTNGTDSGVVVEQMPEPKTKLNKRTLVIWDRTYKGYKQTGYPLTADLTAI